MDEFLFDIYEECELDFVPEKFIQARRHLVTLGRQKGRAVRSGMPYDVGSVTEGKMIHARRFKYPAVLRDAVAGVPTP